ncbi:MAG: CDP-glucose 4,6-dehydratase, partial [bacterium]
MFHEQYRGRKVLVTGHTGFKGSWLALWLSRLGAKVVGYARPPETSPNHWELLKLNSCQSILADLRDQDKLAKAFSDHQPEIVFHLAAQPLVRRSYREPHETFSTNVMGTLNVFEAAIASRSVRAIVCVTSDKVYENQESPDGYQESDRLGGADPYSASKACTEILDSCYSRSFFHKSPLDGGLLLATVRAGNVLGGGDWSEDRLIPDAVRAVVSKKTLGIRNPGSVRPWQHVLEPLSGYLVVGQKLLEGDRGSA